MGSERLCDLRVRVLFWFVFSLPVTFGCSGSFARKPTHPHRSRVLDIQPSLNIRPLHWALPSLTLSSTSATPRSQLQPSRATARPTAGRPTEATARPTGRPWLLRQRRLKLDKLKSLDFSLTQRGGLVLGALWHILDYALYFRNPLMDSSSPWHCNFTHLAASIAVPVRLEAQSAQLQRHFSVGSRLYALPPASQHVPASLTWLCHEPCWPTRRKLMSLASSSHASRVLRASPQPP